MPNLSQNSAGTRSGPGDRYPDRSAAALRSDNALLALRPRYTKGYDASVRLVEPTMRAVVDEPRSDELGPVEVLLAVQLQLADHPATSSHSAIIHSCIERYYALREVR